MDIRLTAWWPAEEPLIGLVRLTIDHDNGCTEVYETSVEDGRLSLADMKALVDRARAFWPRVEHYTND